MATLCGSIAVLVPRKSEVMGVGLRRTQHFAIITGERADHVRREGCVGPPSRCSEARVTLAVPFLEFPSHYDERADSMARIRFYQRKARSWSQLFAQVNSC